MRFLYDLSIRGYQLIVRLAALVNPKARLWIDGRKNIHSELKAAFEGNDRPVAWFHCASLGEFEQGRPVIEAFAEAFPDYFILLTFFSPSGYEIRKNYDGANAVFYLPSDTRWNARFFLHTVNPSIAFFIKYEFWHYYIKELYLRNIPVLSVSSIFRKEQIYFKSHGAFHANILKNISHFFVQNTTSKELLNSLDIHNITVGGDTRFDRVATIVGQRQELPLIKSFTDNSFLFIVGSSWPADLEVIAPALLSGREKLKIIIAPHEIDESSLIACEKVFTSKNVVRYSQLTENNAKYSDILIVDNMGMLSSIYAYGDMAHIGGAFGRGLHNTLEAATFGLPMTFGPSYEKFQEAKDLVELESATVISESQEFQVIFEKLLKDSALRKEKGQRAANYVQENTGSTEKIIAWCKTHLTK